MLTKKAKKKRPQITAASVENILAFLPLLESNGKNVGMLMIAFYKNGFVQQFDAHAFFNKNASRYIEDETLIQTADLTTCVKLITAHCRCDHFCNGHFDETVECGHFTAILRRLAELRQNIAPELKKFRAWQRELDKTQPLPPIEPEVRKSIKGSEEPTSLARSGQLNAPRGCFRVVAVDTFEGPDADYLVGDFPYLEMAKDAADRRGQKMNPVYVYDEDGNLVHQVGTP